MALDHASEAFRPRYVVPGMCGGASYQPWRGSRALPPTRWRVTPWDRLLHFAMGSKRESITHGYAGEEINR